VIIQYLPMPDTNKAIAADIWKAYVIACSTFFDLGFCTKQDLIHFALDSAEQRYKANNHLGSGAECTTAYQQREALERIYVCCSAFRSSCFDQRADEEPLQWQRSHCSPPLMHTLHLFSLAVSSCTNDPSSL